MKRATTILGILLAGCAGVTVAQDSAPDEQAGWTGATNPQDVIAARQSLMLAMQDLMLPIDSHAVDAEEDPGTLTAAASSIAAMLLATPHLFPPSTNLYDPADDMPATIALPKIWDEFSAFYTMAMVASTSAATMAEMHDAEELRTASIGLRASCDACHTLYMRPYTRSTVTEEDRDFDFDSIFEN
jgi:cytochrome c556